MVLLIVNMTIIKISLRGTKDDLAMTSMLIPVSGVFADTRSEEVDMV